MDVPLRLYPRKFHLSRDVVVRHISRYLKCVALIPDEHMYAPEESHWLDFGCGSGYGTNLLSNFVRRVDGFDEDREAIAYAVDQGSAPGVRFLNYLGRQDLYEVIFMVEVAEHMAADQLRGLLGALSAFHLNVNGNIIVTTPIVAVTGPSETNPHHVCEYSFNDFVHLAHEALLDVKHYKIEKAPSTTGQHMEQGVFVLGAAE
jgi:2-polyprenyl-3-methyl-5-hydroxy-6-metoxy-1,4-benzoquinol methylase